ncbi:alpha/beta hydrolase [Temperatibacter marinus]|uniref:Alpha/beta hydrolase n=1 Tax=Temperatibacter marinus TaxID=1456591 RepID=A0AA52EFK8_9PROT|nr:alpha/beta hydrolase [Temperatibacter marinus]WND01624.1 alpha/beta hydrolase [Temperatibacter marinus]
MHTNMGNREGSQLIDTPTGMIHVVREGNKKADTLVLIHGNYFGLAIWDSWVERLRDDFDIIRFDLPGFGLSHPPRSGQYTDHGDIDVIRTILSTFEISQAHFIGSVLGGKIAYQMAANYPQHVQSLTLINSAGLPHHAVSTAQPSPLPEDVKQTILSTPESFLEQVIAGYRGPQAKIDKRLAIELIKLSARPNTIKEILKRMESFIIGPAETTLAKVTCNSLLLHGTNNPHYKVSDVETFKKLLSNSKCKSISYDGYGHLLPLEKSEQSILDLESFLKNRYNFS